MRLIRFAALACFMFAAQDVFAQAANPLTNGARVQFRAVKDFIVRAAEKVPEDLYAFRATPDVRTMAQLFGHVADGFFGMCAAAQGEKPSRVGIEKSMTTKADLVKVLNEAATYCDSVFDKMDDKRGAEIVSFYFGPTPRLSVLYFATTHAYEHYGNLVTYMRLKNIVPPSSEKPTP